MSGNALDTIWPHAAADLASALQRQPELVREAADGRSQGAIRVMQLEAEIRIDPAKRADRFVNDWQRLSQQREGAIKSHDQSRASVATGSMGAMAKSLERDPQVESLLRARKIALGLSPDRSADIAHQLSEYLGRGRTRDIGISISISISM